MYILFFKKITKSIMSPMVSGTNDQEINEIKKFKKDYLKKRINLSK